MKKLIGTLLAFAMLSGILALPANAAGEVALGTAEILARYYRYDVNGDTQFTTDDAVLVLSSASGITPDADKSKMDLDEDGVVTAKDAVMALEVAAGIRSVELTPEEQLSLFNAAANEVKTSRPGVKGSITSTCTSMLVTTNGMKSGTIDMDVTDKEFRDYCDDLIAKLKWAKTLTLLDPEKAQEIQNGIDELESQKVSVYEPSVVQRSAQTGKYHGVAFPVSGLAWASKLTDADVLQRTFKRVGERFEMTVKLADYTYLGTHYPSSKSELQELPYGRVFSLPVYSASTLAASGTVLDEMQTNGGTVTFSIDAHTGQLMHADYSFRYVVTTTKTESTDTGTGTPTTMTMITKLFETVKESYDMTALAAE